MNWVLGTPKRKSKDVVGVVAEYETESEVVGVEMRGMGRLPTV